MNTAAKVYPLKKDISTLALEYMRRHDLDNEAFGKMIKYSRTALSQYFSGKYTNPKNVEKAIISFFKAEGELPEEFQLSVTAERSKFYLSRDAKEIIGLCQTCQDDRDLGVICGKTGYGKTYTLKQYAKTDHVCYIECDDTMSSKDLVEAIEEGLGLPIMYGTIAKRLKHIRESL